jgi:aldehyde dehydrogenase (NAD+)
LIENSGSDTFAAEGIGSAKLLRYYAGKATDIQGESSLQTANFVNLTFRQPFGVCGAIVPWNAPVTMLTFKLAAALITGNTLVAKSSEKAPLTCLFIGKLCQQAGIPPGVVNILSGTGLVCGNAMARHMEIRKISFTGSVSAGRAIKKAAAESNLKNVSLELGGKSPLIIFDDAEIEKAASLAAMSILSNSGQQCIASSRIYVQSSIAEEFSRKLVRAIEENGSNPSGNDPLSYNTVRGPQGDKIQFDSIMRYLEDARASNYKFLTGGSREGDKGYFIKPTVIFNPDDKSKVMTEEIFGPVQCLSTFETEEEVMDRANDTEFGLYASVYTRDLSRALRVAKRFEAGTVGINTTSPMMTFDMPFGGWKGSGDGRELSNHSLAVWTELKSVYISL